MAIIAWWSKENRYKTNLFKLSNHHPQNTFIELGYQDIV